MYSSALSVVTQADTWATDLGLEGSALSVYNAGKAQLLELARLQVRLLDNVLCISFKSSHSLI